MLNLVKIRLLQTKIFDLDSLLSNTHRFISQIYTYLVNKMHFSHNIKLW